MNITKRKISELMPAGYNPRKDLQPDDLEYKQLKRSIQEFGYVEPIIYNKTTLSVVGGHQRLKVLKDLGFEEIDCVEVDLTDAQEKALNIALNKISGAWDEPKLKELLEELQSVDYDIEITGFNLEDLENLKLSELEEKYSNSERTPLEEQFIAPPFSVLDSKQGYWSRRKKQWLSLGIRSEEGRDDMLIGEGFKRLGKAKGMETNGTSVFDPVVCEIMYKWFNVQNGSIYDCFAGGSVRGIVAEKCGFRYTGIDLRSEQIEANINNAKEIGVEPLWYCDDSLNVDKYIEDESVDMIFSCPPYADLEVYSDDPRDISSMEYEDFKKTYREIIKKACKKLKNNRFAVFMVGDVRDKKGAYYDFISDTKKAFIDCGLCLYNEFIYLEPIGSAILRAGKTFSSKRKVCKIHQNVLVFYKGDIEKIKENYVNIDVNIEDFINVNEIEEL